MTKPATKTVKLPRSKKGMRLLIANDVLKQLRSKNPPNVRRGDYCLLNNEKQEVAAKELGIQHWKVVEISEHIPALQKHCKVCALGTMLLTEIKFKNEFKTSLAFLDGEMHNNLRRLTKYFSDLQLAMIEYAFEEGTSAYFSDYDDEEGVEMYKAKRFGQKYSDPKERLRAIMRNVVKNDGTFIP